QDGRVNVGGVRCQPRGQRLANVEGDVLEIPRLSVGPVRLRRDALVPVLVRSCVRLDQWLLVERVTTRGLVEVTMYTQTVRFGHSSLSPAVSAAAWRSYRVGRRPGTRAEMCSDTGTHRTGPILPEPSYSVMCWGSACQISAAEWM